MAEIKDIVAAMNDLQRQLEQAPTLNSKGKEMLKALQSTETGTLAQQYAQGATASFSDEIAAAFDSWIGRYFSNNPIQSLAGKAGISEDVSPYEMNLAQERRGMQNYAAENPLKSMGAQAAGALTTALIPSLGQSALGRTGGQVVRQVPTIGRAVGVGTAAGAAEGFGAGEGGLGNRVASAAGGGAVGGVLAPAGEIARRGIGSMARGVSAAIDTPQRFGRRTAQKMLREALRDDGLGTTDDAMEKFLEASGLPYTLADLGENPRALLDAAAVMPGPGKSEAMKFLRDRSKGKAGRITGSLREILGKRGAFFEDYAVIEAARKQVGDRLYRIAHKQDIEVTPGIINVLQTTRGQKAIARAAGLAELEFLKFPNITVRDGKLLLDGDEVKAVNTRFMHYIKMGLDDEIGEVFSSGIGKNERQGLIALKDMFLDEIDGQNKAYKRARDFWAGKSLIMDALTQGRRILGENPEDLSLQIQKMSKSEAEAYRNGAMSAIIDAIQNSVVDANIARNLLKTENKKKLLRLTFEPGEAGDKQFAEFTRNLQKEIDMADTFGGVLGNSRTAARQEAVARIREAVAEGSTPPSSIFDAVTRIIRSDISGVAESRERAVAQQLTKMLTEADPNKVERILASLEKRRLSAVLPGITSMLARPVFNPAALGLIGGQQGGPPAQTILGPQVTGLLGTL